MTIFHHKSLTREGWVFGPRMKSSIIHDSICSLIHTKCHHKSYQGDIKYHMTPHIIFSVASSTRLSSPLLYNLPIVKCLRKLSHLVVKLHPTKLNSSIPITPHRIVLVTIDHQASIKTRMHKDLYLREVVLVVLKRKWGKKRRKKERERRERNRHTEKLKPTTLCAIINARTHQKSCHSHLPRTTYSAPPHTRPPYYVGKTFFNFRFISSSSHKQKGS